LQSIPTFTNKGYTSTNSRIAPGQLTPVTAAVKPHHCPTSEPTTRRLSPKFHQTETPTEMTFSTSAPSTTFKILSISKRWDYSSSDDEDDTIEEVDLFPDNMSTSRVVSVSCAHQRGAQCYELRRHTFSSSAPSKMKYVT
ncbi:hypothetical protein AB6A40_010042, partial [Gnathostoma spinigerum]